MSSPFNLGRYNLTGYNVTPPANIYITAKLTETVKNIIVTVVNNSYPTARLYENIRTNSMKLIPGRFVSGSASAKVDNTKAHLLGIQWREIAYEENIRKDKLEALRYFWLEKSGTETLDTERMNLLGCQWRDVEMAENVENVKAEALGYFWQNPTPEETISAEIQESIKACLETNAAENIRGKHHLSELIQLNESAMDEITGRLILGSNTFVDGETLDLIDAICDAENNEILTCVLTVTLNPGDVMIIDANTYNVWINQENAVYVHSGDWIDELNRNTRSLTITAASGAAYIDASILYTERFL